ncbi:MAG: DegQ family serine endoprotease [Verrucomicrobiae bacterium]|nr:DegQ family serine endoprotease [Verrucomicrobiae bacterium]
MKTSVKTTLTLGASLSLALAFLFTELGWAPNLFGASPELKLDNTPIAEGSRPTFTFGPVIKKVTPSVVNIYTAKTVRENLRLAPFFDDPFFRDFFGLPFGQQDVPRERREQALGSGVIVTEDGYILTNNHVVEGADEIKVALADEKTTYSAKVIGTDPQTDIAVIKVEAKNLPAITVTDSDHLAVGDVVLAIGNPFGVGQTVTMGIVSAKGRGGMGIVDYEDFIQTDASINPGNSGGALVDAAGRLVGINTAILSRTGGNLGVGFAVPINLARYVMERIIADGKVTRGYLGVMIQPVTADLAKEFKLSDHGGALIAEVTKDSPADKAGLKVGDVVIEFNGKKVTDSRHLRLMVAQTIPDTKVPLKVIRDAKEQTFTVKLAELPSEKGLAKAGGRSGGLRRGAQADPLDGVAVEDLDARSRREFDIPSHVRGALVTDVDPASPAAAAGLREGDVILEINRQPVNNADEAVHLSERIRGDRVLLRIWSRGGSRYVIVEVRPKGR